MTQIGGARYSRQTGTWSTPLSWQACLSLRGLFGEALEIGPELSKWAFNERNSRIMPAMSLRDALYPTSENPHLDKIEYGDKFKLFPYQRVDVDFLTTTGRALLANEPGLGKTGAAIRTLQVLDEQQRQPFPALVVCPNSLKFTVWEREIFQWAGDDLRVQVVDGSASKRRKALAEVAEVYVMNWESVRLHTRMAAYGSIELSEAEREEKELNGLGIQTVIMDEAHRLKDPKAKQTRALWYVCHQAKFRFALTGTPVTSNIGDLWSLLHAVDPEGFPTKSRFLDRYATKSFNRFGGMDITGVNPYNQDELFSLIDPVIRRVPKKAALPQLPDKLPVQYRETPMTPKQQKAYDQMASSMIAMLNELLVAPNALSQLTRLAQFAAASAEIDENGKVRLSGPSAKVDDLMDLLGEMGDAPLVVAAVSRQLIELAAAKLKDAGISFGLVTGAQSPFERAEAVKWFQDGKIRVILLTLGAGAEGITLTRADTMLFMQEDFSEVKNLQAQDRIYRIGAEGHQAIRIIKQVTPGSVEERKIQLLQEKRGRMEEIIRDEQTLLKLLGGK